MLLLNHTSAGELFKYLTMGLKTAQIDRDHPWRLPVLISSGEGRIVVLREVDETSGSWIFFTDRRSTKVAQLSSTSGLASAAFYHPEERTQLRLNGVVVETDRVYQRKCWDQLKNYQRLSYATFHPPGTALSKAGRDLSKNWELGLPSEVELNSAFENFIAYSFRIEKIELLVLNRDDSRRCSWQSWNAEDYTWLVP